MTEPCGGNVGRYKETYYLKLLKTKFYFQYFIYSYVSSGGQFDFRTHFNMYIHVSVCLDLIAFGHVSLLYTHLTIHVCHQFMCL